MRTPYRSIKGVNNIEENNVKVFTLSDTSDLTNAQAACDWYLEGNGIPVIAIKTGPISTASSYYAMYYLNYFTDSGALFSMTSMVGPTSTKRTFSGYSLFITIESGVVQAIQSRSYQSEIVSELPSTPGATTLYFITGS